MIRISNFSKNYSGTEILSFHQLDLGAGIYWIQGENGSGKTTFFKALAGLNPCSGLVQFDDGVELHQHPVEFRSRVNYSEAEPLYPGFLTPKDLIRFVAKAKRASISDQEKLVERFGIRSFFEKPVDTFSSGMLKKVSLAMAFLGSPSLIILDEPLITLDGNARQILFEQIADVLKERPVTVLLSSHQAIESPLVNIIGSFRIGNKTMVPA